MIDLIKLFAIFALIIILLRRRVHLGIVMLVAALVLGFISQLSPQRLIEVGAYTATQFSTINLIVALVLIMFLENVMRRTQMMRRMIDSLSALIGDRRLVMAMLPAFLGFLPSAGGARFSAPMVGEVSRDLPMTAESRSFVNYWYRHIWEFSFPLYPALILEAEIVRRSVGDIVIAQFPLTVAAIVLGAPMAFRGLRHVASYPVERTRQNVGDLVSGISPVLAVIALVIGARLDVSVALAIVLVGLLVYKRYGPRQVGQMVREAFSFEIVLLVYGVLLFKDVLGASGSIESIRVYFETQGVPSLLVVLALPFIVGLLTGVTQAPIGVTFPILVGLSAAGVDLRMVALAYASGFAGVMLSPMHLCLPLTTDHFKARTGAVLQMVALPELAIVLVALGLFLVHP